MELTEDDFLDFLVLTYSREGEPPYYMKLIDIHDVVVSFSAWVSHAMPLINFHFFVPSSQTFLPSLHISGDSKCCKRDRGRSLVEVFS